ncbi:proteasome maturation factor UMP1-domain-containing protein [Dactylonectria estremocensis]|uniref:Proteasome maturation factor UMP1-domain-containing protein n=1 Tax=Dactylonectria estremocensis TaxID=1079267 RepID=A0A9P9F0T4_9HYPO|nr:proteasome maturation factor UMP1-domain-containing protein [Dactylonectria estremocensis]
MHIRAGVAVRYVPRWTGVWAQGAVVNLEQATPSTSTTSPNRLYQSHRTHRKIPEATQFASQPKNTRSRDPTPPAVNMSMRIVPANSNPQTFSHTSHSSSAPSAPGVHDTLRHGVGINPHDANSSTPVSAHPLEARLKNWEATQESMRMETLRRTFGIAEPIRRGMELKIVRDGEWRPVALGGGLPSLHEEILKGREDMITWEDIYTGDETRAIAGVHDEMEKKLKIQ